MIFKQFKYITICKTRGELNEFFPGESQPGRPGIFHESIILTAMDLIDELQSTSPLKSHILGIKISTFGTPSGVYN